MVSDTLACHIFKGLMAVVSGIAAVTDVDSIFTTLCPHGAFGRTSKSFAGSPWKQLAE